MTRSRYQPPRQIAAIRYANGAVDDVAISCDLLRLEQMDTDRWWVSAERADGTHAMFNLYRRGKRVVAECYEDTIGCRDDTAERKEGSE